MNPPSLVVNGVHVQAASSAWASPDQSDTLPSTLATTFPVGLMNRLRAAHPRIGQSLHFPFAEQEMGFGYPALSVVDGHAFFNQAVIATRLSNGHTLQHVLAQDYAFHPYARLTFTFPTHFSLQNGTYDLFDPNHFNGAVVHAYGSPSAVRCQCCDDPGLRGRFAECRSLGNGLPCANCYWAYDPQQCSLCTAAPPRAPPAQAQPAQSALPQAPSNT